MWNGSPWHDNERIGDAGGRRYDCNYYARNGGCGQPDNRRFANGGMSGDDACSV
eukprot:gene6409-1683_t